MTPSLSIKSTLSHAHSFSHTLTPCSLLTRSHTHSHTFTRTLSFTHSHTLTRIHTHSHALTYTHTHSHALTHTLTHIHTHSLSDADTNYLNVRMRENIGYWKPLVMLLMLLLLLQERLFCHLRHNIKNMCSTSYFFKPQSHLWARNRNSTCKCKFKFVP